MNTQLKKGVTLTVIPTEKFKTVRVLIRFSTMLEEETVTKRTLLSSLLETNSKNYPVQTDISEKLAEMYGTSFNIYVGRKGNHHWLSLAMNFVNDKYLNDENENVLDEAIRFIEEILFSPNIQGGKFHEETFQREKENLKQYMDSVKEDKQYYASLALNKLFFRDSAVQGMPSFGKSEYLEKETSQSLASYYRQVLTQDDVDILVIGDVEEKEIAEKFSKLPFVDRLAPLGNIFYTPTENNVINQRVEREHLAQSKLNLAYRLPIRYDSPRYFALQVFNGLFGGFAHSKLFMNIREKESMAYYASSSFDSFRGLLTVQTGIDAKNEKRVLHMIHEELENIRLGNITKDEMEQTKAMLKNSYLLGLDNANSLIEKQFIEELIPKSSYSQEEWMKLIDFVTKEQVMKIAEEVELQAIFFLEGTEEESGERADD
ncbi:MAG: insulinase family protein [Lactobacillales bacterium]|jgi:predicted Zn-dependent peptidase|nr:insulinase family protein [Lactobacillales bacterium]